MSPMVNVDYSLEKTQSGGWILVYSSMIWNHQRAQEASSESQSVLGKFLISAWN